MRDSTGWRSIDDEDGFSVYKKSSIIKIKMRRLLCDNYCFFGSLLTVIIEMQCQYRSEKIAKQCIICSSLNFVTHFFSLDH